MDEKWWIVSFLAIYAKLFCVAFGSLLDYDVTIYNKVIHDAQHWWNFDEATSLYSIFDKITSKRASIREGGAKLTRLGGLQNNFLTLEGLSSSIELGRFNGCIGDISQCRDGLSFSLWLRFRNVAGEDQYILGNMVPGTGQDGFAFIRTKENKMRAYFLLGLDEYHATYNAKAGIWLHHVVTWNGKLPAVYVDGRKLINMPDSRKMSLKGQAMEGDRAWKRGRPWKREHRQPKSSLFTVGGHGFKSDADYDNVVFWDRELNETEAAVMYYRELDDLSIDSCTTSASTLCLHWKLPHDPFHRIRSLSLTYNYFLQPGEPHRKKLNVSSNSICIKQLAALTTYVFALEASIGAGVKLMKSKEGRCRTIDGIPSAPNLSINKRTSTWIEAVVVTPSPANGAIIFYTIIGKEAETNSVKFKLKWNRSEGLPGQIEEHRVNVTKLDPGTVYVIEARAVSKKGQSQPAKITINTKGIAVRTNDIRTDRTSFGCIKLSWNAIPNAESYLLTLVREGGIKISFNVTGNSTKLNSLLPLTTYTVDILPVFRWGEGPGLSKKYTIKTPGSRSIPQNIKAIAIGWDKISVHWTQLATENVTYIVFLRAENTKQVSMETRKDHVTFNLLKPLTTYLIGIQVRFPWGLGPRVNGCGSAKTKDKDECESAMANRCHQNADCFNIEGSYLCQCRQGFVGDGFDCILTPADAKETDFCQPQIFRDVQWPKVFKGGIAVRKCPNETIGFASRRCLFNSVSRVSVYDLPNLSDCVSEDVVELGKLVEDPSTSAIVVGEQLKKVSTMQKLYGGDVKKTVVYYDKTVEEKLDTDILIQDMKQDLLDVASSLLNKSVIAAWKDLPQNARSDGMTAMFNGLENLGAKISKNFKNSSMKEGFRSANIDLQIQRVNHANDSLTYSGSNTLPYGKRSKILLPTKEIVSQEGDEAADILFFTYANIDKILGIEKKPNLQDTGRLDILNSKVVSAVVLGAGKMYFNSPVVLVLPHLKKERVLNTSCVFWNISRSPQSKWLDSGCFVNYTDANQTICHCYHLTNFAVLMTVSTTPTMAEARGHHFALRIITIIGLTISIIAMSVAFVTFCCFRFLRSPRTMYHKHLLTSLILANLLFLVGIDKTQNRIVCSVIAAFLHYFFVVAFVWMAMEGILLYFMLKKIFSSRNFLKRKRCLALCWALPALYVGLLSSLKLEHYGNSNYCWISRQDGFIWSFVAPVSLTLLINFTVMGFAFQVMSEKRTKAPDDGTASDVWYWLKGCLVLTCLLGVTWLVGVFYINSNTVAFAYLFTLLNALQGLFIFIFHCLIDSRVRSEYMRLIKCQKRYEYNEKAGYSSSMKMRKLSGSIKSFGSLDRSTSHNSAKRKWSNSLDRSLLRQNNGSISELGKFTLQRSISSTKSEKCEKNDGALPERQPLVQRSFSSEATEPALPPDGPVSDDLQLHDEKAGSSYSSVFESENEEKRQSRGLDVRDSFCLPDPTIQINKRRWDTPTQGSDSGVSFRSDVLQGDSFESTTDQRDTYMILEMKETYSVASYHLEVSKEPALLLRSQNARTNSLQSLDAEQEREVGHKDEEEASVKETHLLAEVPELEVEIMQRKTQMPDEIMYEEPLTFSFVEDKRSSAGFEKLESILPYCDDDDEHEDDHDELVDDEDEAFDVFQVESKSLCLSQASPVRKKQLIEFEVEDLPKIEYVQAVGRCGSPDKKERAETSLKIGVPRLISVSSIESEPVSPIIISINPDDREFSMLEAEIEFSEDTMSNYSEAES